MDRSGLNAGNNIQELQLALTASHHENTLLKTELYHALQQHEREVKELRVIHQAKMKELEQKMVYTEERSSESRDTYMRDQKILQQLNLQLNQKLQICEDEANMVHRDQEKQKEQNLATLKLLHSTINEREESLNNLKAKNLTLEEQVRTLEVEVDKESMVKHELEITLSSERHQMKLIKSRLDEIEEHFQRQLTSSKTETEHYRSEMSVLEESLQNKIEELKNSLDKERQATQKTKERASKAEKDWERKFAELRQNHLAEAQALTLDNNKLIEKLQNMQQNKSLERLMDDNSSELSQQLQAKIEELQTVQKENLILQGRINHLEEVKNVLSKEKKVSDNLNQEISDIVSQLQNIKRENSDLLAKNRTLADTLSETEEQLRLTFSEHQHERAALHQKLADMKLKEEEHRTEAYSRINSLESQITNKTQEFFEETKNLKEKLRLYSRLIKKLRFRLESAGLKEQELEARHFALKEDSVPSHQYRLLQQQLQKIINKHTEFKAVIQGLTNTENSFAQVADLTQQVNSIGDRLAELEMAQQQAFSEIETL